MSTTRGAERSFKMQFREGWRKGWAFRTAAVTLPSDSLQTRPLACQAAVLFGEPARRRLLAADPSPYLQFSGVGGDFLGDLDNLALLANEDPACAAAGVALGSWTAHQQKQQPREEWRHPCLHVCAHLFHLKGRSAETSQTNSLSGWSAQRARKNHVALGERLPSKSKLAELKFMDPEPLWPQSRHGDERCWFAMTEVVHI